MAPTAPYRNVVGTYLHGPLLAKNPEVADWHAPAQRAAPAKKAVPPSQHSAPWRPDSSQPLTHFLSPIPP